MPVATCSLAKMFETLLLTLRGQRQARCGTGIIGGARYGLMEPHFDPVGIVAVFAAPAGGALRREHDLYLD